MSSNKTIERGGDDLPGSPRPTWWIMFTRELTDLWIGGKAFILMLIYTVLLGIVSFVFASNSELSLIPPKEMVFEMLKIALAFGGFVCLIIGADSISGERERSTLEWLLLTPASRRQIVMGKFFAAVSPWPAAMLVCIPYLWGLSQGDEAFSIGALWGMVLGSMIVPGLAGLGMLVSLLSNSNKTSYFASLGLYIFLLVPTQLPGTAQTGAMGKLLKKLSPMESVYHFLEKIIVNNRPLSELTVFLLAPGLFALIMFVFLFIYSKRGLGLEAGKDSRLGRLFGRVVGLVIATCLIGPLLGVSSAMAFQQEELDISINMEYAVVNTGDPIFYDTVITNLGGEATPPLIVAMNIINLDAEGDIVDPEDWSPQRTQYLESLGQGQTATLSWRVNAILEGDYMVYMVVMPKPEGEQATSQPSTSPSIHLTVMPFTRLNPGGILPYAVGGPILMLIIIVVVFRYRQKKINAGEP